MLLLISPAKSLDFERPPAPFPGSSPELIEHSTKLMKVLAKLSAQELCTLQKISTDLGTLNAQRNRAWQPQGSHHAVYAFRGDVYTGLNVDAMQAPEVQRLNQRLRILSGLYGLLRPLDQILPYRLEMGTRLENPKGPDLYRYWGTMITDQINRTLADNHWQYVVNLASNEYFRSVQKKHLNAQVISPRFLDEKNGTFKVISFYAKRARGSMAAWIAHNDISQPDDLIAFDQNGYYYSAADSSEDVPTFCRKCIV